MSKDQQELVRLLSLMKTRRETVKSLLEEWCKDERSVSPYAPCCILKCEKELLDRYLQILAQELWYAEEDNHAQS